ncbi:porin [Candidatus Halocynthiibacter alkanivorans]|uniref:porin n=1 Tax=Candidatus Halocynthiibacter alkanivorans TaxID=2267619 RepID=UPI000DF25122|nr:porin [Candidatus Halocynthiibacter alkanivorans]
MKKIIVIAASSIVALSAVSASAQQITGGEASITYSAFSDNTDLSATSLDASLEFGISRELGLQLDMGSRSFNTADETAQNYVLHGIYNTSESVSLGVFYGIDRLDGENADIYGLEMGAEMGALDLEAYWARGDLDSDTGDGFGIAGRTKLANGTTLGLRYESVDFGGVLELSNFAVEADYAISDTVSLNASYGTAEWVAGGTTILDEPFFAIGATFTFGAERGTTFGKRSVFSILPGA